MYLLDFAKWLNNREAGWRNIAYIWTCNKLKCEDLDSSTNHEQVWGINNNNFKKKSVKLFFPDAIIQ